MIAEKAKKTVGFLGRQIIAPYAQLGKSAKGLAQAGREAADEIKESARGLRKHEKTTDPIFTQASKIKDDHQRFEFVYKQKKWDEPALRHQLSIIKWSQALYLFFTLAMGLIGLFELSKFDGSNWSTIVIAVLTCAGVGALGGMAWISALRKTQVQERALMSFTKFTGRSDFYKKVLWPAA